MNRWEHLADKIASSIGSGAKLLVLYAPTSYGKTMASPFLLKYAKDKGLARRLIHVVPTRALLRQIYDEKFSRASEELGLKASYQSHDMIPGGSKSPYFLSDITVTTLESFLLNAYKLQPTEISKLFEGTSSGHYYPAFTALSTAIVVFDEAHMYIVDDESSDRDSAAKLVISAISALLKLEVPVVLATATLSTKLLKSMTDRLGVSAKVLYVCGGSCPQMNRLESMNVQVERIQADQSWSPPQWKTSIVTEQSALEVAGKRCGEELVLYVSNTVKGALDVYKKLEKCERALIHGKLSEGDRKNAMERIEKLRGERRGLIVASPIAEVGVDIDATVLITEPAPIDSLAQRVGRLCRRSCSKGEVYIIEDDASKNYGEIVEKIKRVGSIEWRALWSTPSGMSYVELLDELDASRAAMKSSLFEDIVLDDARPLDYISQLENEFPGLSLFKLKVGDGEVPDYVIVSKRDLNEKYRDCVMENGYIKVTILVSDRGGKSPSLEEVKIMVDKRITHKGIIYKLRENVNEGKRMFDYFVNVKEGCYKESEGLLTRG